MLQDPLIRASGMFYTIETYLYPPPISLLLQGRSNWTFLTCVTMLKPRLAYPWCLLFLSSCDQSCGRYCSIAIVLAVNLTQSQSPTKREIQLKNCPGPIGLRPCLWGISLVVIWCKRAQPTVSGTTQGQAGLGYVTKVAEGLGMWLHNWEHWLLLQRIQLELLESM